jgi:hypothetical protein
LCRDEATRQTRPADPCNGGGHGRQADRAIRRPRDDGTGRIGWWPAWAALAVMAAWTIATAVVVLRLDPALLAERLGPRKGAKHWDIAIMSVLGLTQLARYVVAGLDERYGWTGGLPSGAQIAGALVCALGYALVVWATASNPFFSQVVRIQSERGQVVVSGGPTTSVIRPTSVRSCSSSPSRRCSLPGGPSSPAGWARRCSSFGRPWKTARCRPSSPATTNTCVRCLGGCFRQSGSAGVALRPRRGIPSAGE